MSSLLFAGLLGFLAQDAPLPHLLEVATRSPVEGRPAALRAALEPADVPAALTALERWPAGAGLALRAAIVQAGRLRTALLAEALAGNAAAVRLLVEQFLLRLDHAEPWADGVMAHRDRPDLLLSPGLRLSFWTPPGTRMTLGELIACLEESGSFAAPPVVFPGLDLESVVVRGDGRSRPAEWVLEEGLRDAGLRWERLLRATWIIDDQEPELARSEFPDDEIELHAMLRRREAARLERALRCVAELPAELRWWEAAAMLERLGLPCSAADLGSPVSVVGASFRPGSPFSDRVVVVGGTVRRRRARALAASTVGDLPLDDPALAAFVAVRRDPGSSGAAALAWIAAGAPQAGLDAQVRAGCAVLLRSEPRALRTVAARLPWSWRTRVDPDAASGLSGIARALVDGDPGAAELLLALRDPATEPVIDEVLAALPRAALLLGVLEEACRGLQDRSCSAAEFTRIVSRVRYAAASCVGDEPLLAGRARASLRDAAKGFEGPGRERLVEEAERFWVLGSAARSPDWWLELGELGWLSERKRLPPEGRR